MTTPGSTPDIAELLRQHGKDSFYALAKQAGLKKGAMGRIQCPFPGCADHGPDRPSNLSVFAGEGGKYKAFCHRCAFSGDLLDFYEAVKHWTRAEAIDHLRGLGTPAARPALRVVPSVPVDDGKLKPAEIRKAWDALAAADELGKAYLTHRGLGQSGLVRYATEACTVSAAKAHAQKGRRVAMLLTDIHGEPRGIQFRAVGEVAAGEKKQAYLKGSTGRHTFFGNPELVEASPLVGVAEGMADTMALGLWAPPGGCVVGAPGIGALAGLAEALKAAGVPLDGKLFVLFPQNDRPKNRSRKDFTRLAQLLAVEGAHVVFANTPEAWKDLADWRKDEPELAWPPAELARVLTGEPGDEIERPMVLPAGAAIAIPTRFSTQSFAPNMSTLLTLLDDPLHREPVLGAGALQLSAMTGEISIGGRELLSTDYTAIRYGLEKHVATVGGKPLKFSRQDIEEALQMLATRNPTHKLTEWVRGLKWDKSPRLDAALPVAMNQKPGSLEALLLRKWFISTAARALQPGCKVDTVLVLIGPQGCGKSRFCRAIGGPWFTDARVDVESDNGKRLMRRSWIVEWAELTAMRRARDAEAIKAFLSQQVDVYRPLYKEMPIEAPRHSVIVGTTNDDEFLRDPTGARRFWSIRVKEIDVAWILENREQLIAEAAIAVMAGEQWWLERDRELELAEHNEEFQAEDDWRHLIQEFWAEHLIWVETTTAQVLENVIKKDKQHWTQLDHNRVADALRSLGWERRRPRIPGQKQRAAVWYPPARSEGGA